MIVFVSSWFLFLWLGFCFSILYLAVGFFLGGGVICIFNFFFFGLCLFLFFLLSKSLYRCPNDDGLLIINC